MSFLVLSLCKDFYTQEAKDAWVKSRKLAAIRWEFDWGTERFPAPWTDGVYKHNRRRDGSSDVIGCLERWNIILLSWKLYLKKYPQYAGRIFLFSWDATIRDDEPDVVVDDDDGIFHIRLKFRGQVVKNHLAFKTIAALKFLRENKDKYGDYTYYVRTGLSCFLDLKRMEKALQAMPKTDCHCAPFWDAGRHAYGAFNCVSSDIVDYMIANPDPRLHTQGYPDDSVYHFAAFAKKSGGQYPAPVCYWYGNDFGPESKWNAMQFNYAPNKTYWNPWGFSASKQETCDQLLEKLTNIDTSRMFFYRCNYLGRDPDYVRMYKRFMELADIE